MKTAQEKRGGPVRKTYSEKLKDPRWQKRRLEIMKSADFKCEYCGNAAETLHIHHLRYRGEPWEARDEDLECLCETHHALREANEGEIAATIFFRKDTRAALAKRFLDVLPKLREAGVSLESMVETMEEASGKLTFATPEERSAYVKQRFAEIKAAVLASGGGQ